jgi:hypothetical protein
MIGGVSFEEFQVLEWIEPIVFARPLQSSVVRRRRPKLFKEIIQLATAFRHPANRSKRVAAYSSSRWPSSPEDARASARALGASMYMKSTRP